MTADSSATEVTSPDLVLTIEEAAKVLRIGRTKMCALLASGEVESVCIGRLRRVPVWCLRSYVAGLLTSDAAA